MKKQVVVLIGTGSIGQAIVRRKDGWMVSPLWNRRTLKQFSGCVCKRNRS